VGTCAFGAAQRAAGTGGDGAGALGLIIDIRKERIDVEIGAPRRGRVLLSTGPRRLFGREFVGIRGSGGDGVISMVTHGPNHRLNQWLAFGHETAAKSRSEV
jgi:hypothetical protein